ncbi:uncharacterized protein [Primulina eburnea]|uniref:uncharacterized protein n=1 Tax=Primulina eburnea TaxID=1245227 RepID=UPI003C6C8B2D
MARRSKFSIEFTPNYGWMREPTLVTIKLYYNGSMETNRKRKIYKGDIQSAPQTCNEAELGATTQGDALSDESERFISNKSAERAEAAFKRRKKLQVIRQRATGVTISGSSNNISSVNVHKVLNKQTHVIVKGGRNFVTVSNLRASVDDRREKKHLYNQMELVFDEVNVYESSWLWT